MGIIRFSDEEVFGTDSQEYEILIDAVKLIKGVPGAVVEIGTRRGGSAKMIIDTLVEIGENQDRPMFCIDPYGNIEIECTNKNITAHIQGVPIEGDPQSTELTKPVRLDYNSDMRNRVVPSLMYYAFQRGIDFRFFFLEDIEFFKRYSDGVPIYDQNKTLINEYVIIFFDGPHTNEAIMREVEFFEPRSVKGAIMIFDDIWMMRHDELVETYLYDRGWKLLKKGNVKASYIKFS